ncbi:MAG: c-type cytochrome [Chitinophagales bacterium]|nr:c-type cytochrome [Chitinophagales bacterium]
MNSTITRASKWFVAVIICGTTIALYSFVSMPEDWNVPAEYQNMANPVAYDGESIDIGKTIYDKHCKSCHGKYGEGDGSKAAELDTDCGDFTLEEFQSQSDGSLFYKVLIGRDEMPGFEKKIPEQEDIWHVVNYMRELGE